MKLESKVINSFVFKMTLYFSALLIMGLIFSCKDGTHDKSEDGIVDVPTNEWNEVVSKNKKFRIKFPVREIRYDTLNYLNEDGDNQMTISYSLNLQEQKNLNFLYDVGYIPFPEIKSEEEINQLFDEQKDYIIETFNGVLHYDKILDKPRLKGREINLTMDNTKARLTYRMHFQEPYFYVLQVWTDTGKGNLFNKSINKFLDSFELIK